MNLFFAVTEPLATADAGAGLDVKLVVLLCLVVAVGWLVKSLAALRSEVETLKASLPAKAPPVAGSAQAVKSVAATTAAPVTDGPTPEEFAAIAAAIYCMFGSSARLVAVGGTDDGAYRAWSQEGRRDVFHSHQLR